MVVILQNEQVGISILDTFPMTTESMFNDSVCQVPDQPAGCSMDYCTCRPNPIVEDPSRLVSTFCQDWEGIFLALAMCNVYCSA